MSLTHRWQPTRGGLLNIFRFDHEEFHYEHGRLLLRGNNGTGKSRVLALQLPFLLDGEVAPHRLEPDGDDAKRIEWNLLMGRHAERLGYTWLELGRRTAEGDTYLTLGCGLQAAEGRGLQSRWFFITSQRIGSDLFLTDSARAPLTRERLVNAVGASGNVYTAARDYRRAIDGQLFGLGEERYQALVDLLIQLRQPQLSRKLDEQRLTSALTRAMPRLPASVIADVAESFNNLENDRNALTELEGAARAVDQFLITYRQHVQMAARRRASRVHGAHNDYEAAQRRKREVNAGLAETEKLLEQATARDDQLKAEIAGAETALQTLQQSPEMRGVEARDQARREAAERADEATRAATLRTRAESDCQQTEHDHQHAEARRDEACHAEEQTARKLRDEVAVAGLSTDLVDGLDAALAERRRQAQHLQRCNQALTEAERRHSEARRNQTTRETELDESRQRRIEAETTHEQVSTALLDAFRAWTESLRELRVTDVDVVAAAIAAWTEDPEGRLPIDVALETATTSFSHCIATERARLESLRKEAERDIVERCAERDRLEAGEHVPPAAPPTRTRRERPGAPLYALVDFAGDLDANARAGLEAAMEAAGLLDAWVSPHGSLLTGDDLDTVLAIGTSPLPPPDHDLTHALVADPHAASPVAAETVTRILAHIGWGEDTGHIWVAASGRWQLGPAHGAWTKREACHIGQASRERVRRERLEALALEIATLQTQVARHRQALEQLREREARARDEALRRPDGVAVTRARADVEAAARNVEDAHQRLEQAERETARRRADTDDRRDARDRDAADLRLVEWVDRLDELRGRLDTCARLSVDLAHASKRRHDQEHAAATTAARLASSRERLDETRQQEAGAATRARESTERRDVLEQTVGASCDEILRRVADARARVAALQREKTVAGSDCVKLYQKQAGLEVQREQADARLTEAETDRRAAIESYARMVANRIVQAATPHLDTTVDALRSDTALIDHALAVEAALSKVSVEDAEWDRSRKVIYQHFEMLKDTLVGFRPQATQEEDVLSVTIPYNGRDMTCGDLAETIATEIATRVEYLDAREREILENHLIGDVSLHLRELIHAAREWIRKMNLELERRPTSTGMKLRFEWEPAEDGPVGLREVEHRLMRHHHAWSPDDRRAVGEFLQTQIQQARATIDGGWETHLSHALDYRTWHRFVIMRHQDGHWKRLTRRTHGTGSGGEKVLALTMPQFAAAAAFYSSAAAGCPRLILLDEAFAGVDREMRARCMGLLEAFDLDFVMTSESEWGCYDTVRGLAIYQLATRPGIDAVKVTRWVWTGREKVMAPVVASPMQAEPAPARSDIDTLELFS